jgi:hypothetical protein
MQEELIKVLTLPNCHLKNLSLIHSGLKIDFFNKMQLYLQTTAANKSTSGKCSFLPHLKHINLSKNSIEDRSLTLFVNLYKDYCLSSSSNNHSHINTLTLSKCSISSKGVNQMISTLGFPHLSHLDLSFNHLKDEPTELFRFLADSNHLAEINLSSTDIDMEKVLNLNFYQIELK